VAAEQRPLLRVAAHHQPGHAQLAQPLQHRLEGAAGGAGDGAGEHQVEAELGAVGEQVGEGREQAGGHRRQQVVVVDEEDQPPVVGEQPLAGGIAGAVVPAGQASAEALVEVAGQLRDRAGVGGVAGQVRQAGEVEQAAALVHHQQRHLVGPVAGGQAAGEQAQQAGLAAFGVAEDQEVRRPPEQVEPDRFQPVLLDRERDPLRRPRARRRSGERPLPQQLG
jgi:hypothetical protein